MANQVQPTGRRVFDDAYSFPQDSQDLADDIYAAWNVRVGTDAERQALPVDKQKPGMLWVDSATGIVRWTDGAGSWKILTTRTAEADITPSQNLWSFEWTGYLPGKVAREGDRVFMQGIMSNASSVTVTTQEYKVGTIPLALAPAANVYFATFAAGNGMAVMSVRSNGDVYMQTMFSGGPYAQGVLTVWLDGFTWPAKV